MCEKAPKTVAILTELATLKHTRQWTFEDLRAKINEHLEPSRQIPGDRIGLNQIERWLKPHRKGWTEPRAEFVLAVCEVIKAHSKTLVDENLQPGSSVSATNKQ